MTSESTSDHKALEGIAKFNGTNYFRWSRDVKDVLKSKDLWIITENGPDEAVAEDKEEMELKLEKEIQALRDQDEVKAAASLTASSSSSASSGATVSVVPAGRTIEEKVAALTVRMEREITLKLNKAARIKNDRAYAIIRFSIEGSFQVTVNNDTDSAHEAWKAMSEQYSKKDSLPHKIYLGKCLSALKMSEGGDLQKHLNQFQDICDELAAVGAPKNEHEQILLILQSLPRSYTSVVAGLELLLQDGATFIDMKKKLLYEAQKRRESVAHTQDHDKDMSLLFTNAQRNGAGSNGQFKSNKGRQQKKQFHKNVYKKDIECYNCGEKGHIMRRCPKPKKRADDSDHTLLMMTDGDDADEKKCKRECWYIDSGSTHHMTGNPHCLSGYRLLDNPVKIKVANSKDNTMDAIGAGEVNVYWHGRPITIENVHYVPDLSVNLLSVKILDRQRGLQFFTHDGIMELRDRKGKCICKSENPTGNLYPIRFDDAEPDGSATGHALLADADVQVDALRLWHYRLGHANLETVKQMAHDGYGFTIPHDQKKIFCESCVLGKSTRKPFPTHTQSTKAPMDLVHSDLCGPMQVESLGGARYVCMFTDDYSRYGKLYLLKRKDEVLSKFKEYVEYAKRLHEKGPKIFRSDNGGEYKSAEFDQFCKDQGIVRQFSNANTPQQNGVSERRNRTVMDPARCLLIQAGMSAGYWAEAVKTANHIRNQIPTPTTGGKSPHELWTGEKPDLSSLRVFGSVCYAHVTEPDRKKLDAKSIRCKFLGYPDGIKGYRLIAYDKAGNFGRVINSRDVTFDESSVCMNKNDPIMKLINDEEEDDKGDETVVSTSVIDGIASEAAKDSMSSDDQGADNEANPKMDVKSMVAPFSGSDAVGDNDDDASDTASSGSDEIKVPVVIPIPRPRRAWKPTEKTLQAFSYFAVTVPQALDNPNWKKAMDEEMASHEKNGTWEWIDRPKDKKVIGSRWVFALKRNEKGDVVRWKARFVARGYNQVAGIDYGEVYAPVASMTTFRLLMAIAARNKLLMVQLDVKTAFLNGTVDEQIYLEPPEGYRNGNKVCLLKRSLYGLKQASHQWNQEVDTFLKSLGYKCTADTCLYVKRVGSDIVFLLIYVDDIILAASIQRNLDDAKSQLEDRYDMSDKGPPAYFLGMEIKRTPEGITINQERYLLDVLERFKMQDCKSQVTPQEVTRLHKRTPEEARAQHSMPDPSTKHEVAGKRILRYIRGTTGYGITYPTQDDPTLSGYVDSDYAGDIDDRKSTTGFVFQFGSAPISWRSRKQPVVTLSTTEAELVAASAAAQEASHLRALLQQMGKSPEKPTVIHEDNQSVIAMTKAGAHPSRMKHLDVKHCYVRQCIAEDKIKLEYCRTSDMIADMLTKPVGRQRFVELRTKMGIGPGLGSGNT